MSMKSNEDQIVPALSMKQPIDFNTVGEADFDFGGTSNKGEQESVTPSQEELKLSNLSVSSRAIADQLVPFFGE